MALFSIFIGLFIGLLIIYVVASLIHYFIFKALGIAGWQAFVPFYSNYKLLSEYKGRVYAKNWGVLYLISITLAVVAISLFIGMLQDPLRALGALLVGIVLLLIVAVMSSILEVLMYLPIMYTSNLKIAFFVLFIINIVVGFTGNMFSSKSTINPADYKNFTLNYTDYLLSLAVPIIYFIFKLVVAYKFYKKVTNDGHSIVTKLNIKEVDIHEFRKNLQQRDKNLLAKSSEGDKSEEENFYV